MKSMFGQYSEHKESYYGIPCEAEKLFTNNYETSKVACERFLNEYFMKGEKKKLLDNDLIEQYKQQGKHVHSVSLYLLGRELIPLFQKYIDDELKKIIPNYTLWCNNAYDFQYVWYLPSMYHDFASCIETGTIRANDSEQRLALKFHLGNHNIRYSPYASFPYKTMFPYGISEIPFRFSPELIANYFYYRACNGQCEHGIIAGYMFFDRFVKNFLKYAQNGFDYNGNVKHSGLNWNIGHLTYAAYVADAIICHNIWLGGKTEEDTYKQYGLTPLLYTEHPESKLSIEEYPLQFMLCLLDTIEPTKRFMNPLSPHEVLESIGMEYGDRQLSISWNDKIAHQREFSKWHNGIVNMSDWMCVEVKTRENSVTIIFESKMCRN